jgi:hypothetical protein
MTGQLYIDLADAHFACEEEASFRCVLSRYYYGLLHNTIHKLISLDPENENLKDDLTIKQDAKKSIHTGVIVVVKDYNSTVGADLDIAKRLRVLADYHFYNNIEFPLIVNDDYNKPLKSFSSKEELKFFLANLSTKLANLVKPSKRLPIRAEFRGMDDILKKLPKRK